MRKRLILTEKPSVASDIADALGGFEKKIDYYESEDSFITWAVGHLVQLAEPEDYNRDYKYWTLQSLPILPSHFNLKPIAKAEGRLKTISSLAKKSNEVVNACDAGREGELIFRYICDYLGLVSKTDRLWLQSMTQNAILEGFGHLRPSKELINLGEAAKCRSEADWLIGINATRAFTRRLGSLLSIGRVQTPTLAILVGREKEVTAFISQTYYEVFATFSCGSNEYQGKWFIELGKDKKSELIKSAIEASKEVKEGDRLDRLSSRKLAETITKAVNNKNGEVKIDEHKTQKQSPHLLFDLNELQREANRRFGYSASKTLQIAQTLYEEKKLITYPRTDSKFLPEDYMSVVPKIFKVLLNSEFAQIVKPLIEIKVIKNKRIFDNKKVSDHFALIPTDHSPAQIHLTADQAKIYNLVVKRFVAAFYPDAIWEYIKRVTEVEGFTFKTDAKVLKDPGFLSVFGREEEEESKTLCTVKVGDETFTKSSEIFEKQTQPPPRFTDATLLGAMESAGKFLEDEEAREAMKEKGLGTPATRASIIERVIDVGYVERVGKELLPTIKGISLIDLLMGFPLPELCSPEMTGEWESKLASIETGGLSPKDFINSIIDFTKFIVEKVKSGNPEAQINNATGETVVVGKCPLCSADVVGSFMSYRCSNYKPKKTNNKNKKINKEKDDEDDNSCNFAIWRTIAGKIITDDVAKTLLEKGKVGPLSGFRSKAGRPFSATLVLGDGGKVNFEFADSLQKSEDKKNNDEKGEFIGTCPICSGKVYEYTSSYHCENYKKTCNLSLSKVILGKSIIIDQFENLITKRKTDKLQGFISRKGRPFSAYLVLKEDGKVGFEFDPKGSGKERATKSKFTKQTTVKAIKTRKKSI